ncbi:MAG TPA: VRR-NUC domain-containing protein, partial [Steroidobacteraceae bacterium]|nr:VRR-NUC domain-containing protein [Steroidobacteraceae bacterium]
PYSLEGIVKRERPEDKLQRGVIQHLHARGVPNSYFFHVPNGGQRSKIEAAILVGLGVRAGVPDIFIIMNARVFAMELKAPGRRPEPEQREALAALQRAGAITAVCDSIDQAVAILEGWGVLRGRAQLRTIGDLATRMDERQKIQQS